MSGFRFVLFFSVLILSVFTVGSEEFGVSKNLVLNGMLVGNNQSEAQVMKGKSGPSLNIFKGERLLQGRNVDGYFPFDFLSSNFPPTPTWYNLGNNYTVLAINSIPNASNKLNVYSDKENWVTFFTDDFESDFPADWKLHCDSDGLEYTWGVTNWLSHSANKSVWCAGSKFTAGGCYPNCFGANMTYGPFDLSDALEAEVDFWMALDISVADDSDFCACYVSVNGDEYYGNWWRYEVNQENPWEQKILDLCNVYELGNVCGQSQVWIRFYFFSNTGTVGVQKFGKGAFLDDVIIRKKTSVVNNTGAIRCSISSAAAVLAGAQWNVDGGAWQNDGATVANLAAGPHTVSFKAVTGWMAPANQTVIVVEGQTTPITATYTQVGPVTGSITCTLLPAAAVTAGAQWNVDGGIWQNDGATVANLTAGPHIVAFKAITGWTVPANQTVTVIAGQNMPINVAYIQSGQTGSVTCTLIPAEVITAGATWCVDGGAAQNSGATVIGLTAGPHTVSFNTIDGWTAPASQTVTVIAGQNTPVSAAYVQSGTTGSITCTLFPAEVVTAGAAWRVDGGTAQKSGSTVAGLSTGAHTVSFDAVTGWTTPVSLTVTVVAGQNSPVTAAYTQLVPTTGSITCTLSPNEAVTEGAQWKVDEGIWNNNGATVSNVTPGTHKAYFSEINGWVTPAEQTVNVPNGQIIVISATYSKQDEGGCGCGKSERGNYTHSLRRFLSDWLLMGVSLIVLAFLPYSGRIKTR